MCGHEQFNNSEWRRENISCKLPGYRDSWRGLFDHLLDIFSNQPARTINKDYTFSIWVKGNAMLHDPSLNAPNLETKDREG